MAKDKERALNPAAAQRKADKARALKRSRAQVQAQRNERLARRNPERLRRQIDELKQLEAAGDIKQRERDILADLERDLRAVLRAKEALGQTTTPTPTPTPTPTTSLGKRARDGERGRDRPQRRPRDHGDSGSDTDESVRGIPMPEDTPPPVPREHRRYFNDDRSDRRDRQPNPQQQQQPPQPQPQPQPQTTYAAGPQIRDLKKEAVSKFVPAAVRQKLDAVRGARGAGLLEPDEADRLEAQGYMPTAKTGTKEGDDDTDTAAAQRQRLLAEEEARFEREMALVDDGLARQDADSRSRHVQIEDVPEDGL